MTLPISICNKEVEILQQALALYKEYHWGLFDFEQEEAVRQYAKEEEARKMLSQKILFLKLQLAGTPLEEAITILGMRSMGNDPSVESAKSWRDISPCADCEWGMNTPSV
jgi:hypothetical protein